MGLTMWFVVIVAWFVCCVIAWGGLYWVEYRANGASPYEKDLVLIALFSALGPFMLILLFGAALRRGRMLRLRYWLPPDGSEWTSVAWEHKLKHRTEQCQQSIKSVARRVGTIRTRRRGATARKMNFTT